MSISYKESRTEQGLTGIIKLDKGDLDALKDIMDQYNFVDQQALLRYALAVLLYSDDNKLYVSRDGSMLSLSASDQLIEKGNAVAR